MENKNRHYCSSKKICSAMSLWVMGFVIFFSMTSGSDACPRYHKRTFVPWIVPPGQEDILNVPRGSIIGGGEEDFQRWMRIRINIRKLEHIGFSKVDVKEFNTGTKKWISRKGWVRTIIWTGSTMGPVPVFWQRRHGITIRELLTVRGRWKRLDVYIPAYVDRPTRNRFLKTARVLLASRVYGGYPSIGNFIADTQVCDIEARLFNRKR